MTTFYSKTVIAFLKEQQKNFERMGFGRMTQPIYFKP